MWENILINVGSLKGERRRIFSLSGDKEACERYEMLKLSSFSRGILAVYIKHMVYNVMVAS